MLYGATGYTGRLVAAELDRAGAAFAVAGRDARKLDALAAGLAARPETRVADAADAAALRAAFRGARVVVSAAGPFARLGRPALDAALAEGAAWCDIAGEQTWIQEALGRDEAARAAGVAVVPAVGFDVVPSDLAARLAADGWRGASLPPMEREDAIEAKRAKAATLGGEPPQTPPFLRPGFASFAASRFRVLLRDATGSTTQKGVRKDGAPDLAVDLGIVASSGVSGGTRRSMAASAGAGGWWDGRLRPAPPGRFARAFRFPPPWGERACAFIPWGDVVTAPRSTGARRVRTFFAMPAARVRALRVAWPLLAVGAPLLRRRLEAKAAAAREGPSPERRASARFAVVAEARAGGAVRRATCTGRDPYGLTGATAARAAALLAAGRAPAGAWTPAQAFAAADFAEAFARFEVRLAVEPA